MKNFEANGAIPMTRRSLLCGALATPALTVSSAALGQQMQTHLPPPFNSSKVQTFNVTGLFGPQINSTRSGSKVKLTGPILPVRMAR